MVGGASFSQPAGQRAGHGDADSRERLHARIHSVAVAGGGPQSIRGASFRHGRRARSRHQMQGGEVEIVPWLAVEHSDDFRLWTDIGIL